LHGSGAARRGASLFPTCIFREPVDWKGSIGDNTMQFWNDDSIRSVAATPNSQGPANSLLFTMSRLVFADEFGAGNARTTGAQPPALVFCKTDFLQNEFDFHE
jgi:hypothetical protein